MLPRNLQSAAAAATSRFDVFHCHGSSVSLPLRLTPHVQNKLSVKRSNRLFLYGRRVVNTNKRTTDKLTNIQLTNVRAPNKQTTEQTVSLWKESVDGTWSNLDTLAEGDSAADGVSKSVVASS
jgi:hypothetical protein